MAEKSKICPNCGVDLFPDAIRCPSCGKSMPKITNKCLVCGKEGETIFILGQEYCATCFHKTISRIKVSTTPFIDGYKIIENKGVETASVVLGTGLLSEITGEVSDFFGVRSTMFESKLTKAKEAALDKL